MKNFWKYLLSILVASILFLTHYTSTSALDTGWSIKDFHSGITVNEDTSVNVVETIKVDFNSLEKHGIYRDIPVKYVTDFGNNYDVNFELLGVNDAKGNILNTKVTRSGDSVNIRIGDPDVVVGGENTYVISYVVDRVVKDLGDGSAEFYWNVTGTKWPVVIERASVSISSPTKVKDTICFTGAYGASYSECSKSSSGSTATFLAAGLFPTEGLTASIKIDSNGLVFPSSFQKAYWFLRDNIIYLIPVITFFVMLHIYWKKGRDRRLKDIFHETAGYEYVSPFDRKTPKMTFAPPKDLSPGEVGVIVDEKVDNRDITAIAIDLARRGYFKIKETEKGRVFKKRDFELIATGKDEENLNDFEVKLLDLFFHGNRIEGESIKLSNMPKDAYKKQKDVVDSLYKHLTDNGYFVGNPNAIRKKYHGIGAFTIIILSFTFRLIAQYEWAFSFIVVIMVSAAVVMVFARIMPARSPKGRKALDEIVGLREYVRVGAWRQQKYEGWGYFEEILPYTIAFGLTHKFIDAFKDAKVPKPEWYESEGSFRPLYFASSMDSFASNISSGISATKPRSSSSSGFGGGGFSGGGFGGGGGGSW